MKRMKNHFSNTVLFNWAKHFIAAIFWEIIMFYAKSPNIFLWVWPVWAGIISSALYATIMVAYNYLNKNDPRYGNNYAGRNKFRYS